MQSGEHDTCHYEFDEPKTYEEYREESINHYESILLRYAAPHAARPPLVSKTYSDDEPRFIGSHRKWDDEA